MTSITEFLLARITEDERVALAVQSSGKWCTEVERNTLTIQTEGDQSMGWEFGGGSGVWNCDDPYDDCGQYQSSAEREAKHIIRHDPARVLAECKAKRAIIELHKPWGFEYSGGEGCGRCGSPDNYEVYPLPDSERFPCATLRLLASVYADHPDYEQAWRT